VAARDAGHPSPSHSPSHSPHPAEFACVHVRQGDFETECQNYVAEVLNWRTARKWVRSHFQNGYGCWQDSEELELNLGEMVDEIVRGSGSGSSGAPGGVSTGTNTSSQSGAWAPAPAIFASVENSTRLLSDHALSKFHLQTQSLYAPLVGSEGLPLPPALAAILIDQLVCGEASVLMLNAFSTFSLLVLGRIGLQHAQAIGWDVTDASIDKKQTFMSSVGVRLRYWTSHKKSGRGSRRHQEADAGTVTLSLSNDGGHISALDKAQRKQFEF